jgi:hypothetical protein
MGDDLKQSQEMLEQALFNSEIADVRHNALREAFEQRECDLETYLSALRDWMVAKAEVTVAEFRVRVLEPPIGDSQVESS